MSAPTKNTTKNPANKNEILDESILQMFNIDNELKGIEKETKPIDEVTKKWNMNETITTLFANKIETDTKLKSRYALILIIILIIQLISLNTIFVFKGCNILEFSETTFNIFITGGIAEIFVLVRIIVKYLFNDNLTELLKIILRANNNSDYIGEKSNNNNINKLNNPNKKNTII